MSLLGNRQKASEWISALKEVNYPENFLHDCLRLSALINCNSSEGDSVTRGFGIILYIQGIAEQILKDDS